MPGAGPTACSRERAQANLGRFARAFRRHRPKSDPHKPEVQAKEDPSINTTSLALQACGSSSPGAGPQSAGEAYVCKPPRVADFGPGPYTPEKPPGTTAMAEVR